MKNLIYLALMSILVFSCSSDDDSSGQPEDLSQTELLVNGSPWSFDRAEIESVNLNNLDLTNEEIINITENRSFPTFDFKDNGNVLLENNGDEVTASFAILNDNLELVAQDGSELTLESFEVNETEFSFESQQEEVDSNENITLWTAVLIYN